ncbi:isochorismate synthase [Citricoccus sp. NR2]|uniref:isochorismate synthase n=1 Tax=Citricoccus sp. NR2 TaxID=3004095 RepID=UPI0022DD8978|nr:isochorismate synthase [Citricoccus sp. NR2]WBL20500.1 isochorismate synthase [Citricoccus sp. NR2]
MTELVCVVRAVNPASVPIPALLDIGPTSMWWRHGAGLLGWGEAAVTTTRGPSRFADARDWWEDTAGRARVFGDTVPGRHVPVAFASFTFDARSRAESVITVPEILIINRPEGTWLVWQRPMEHTDELSVRKAASVTTEEMMDRAREFWDPVGTAVHFKRKEIADFPWPRTSVPVHELQAIPSAAMGEHDYVESVAEALSALQRGPVRKIVMARDEVVYLPEGIDVPRTLTRLTRDYEHCWTYLVHGLVGATPELLIARKEGHAEARVLAGTADRNVVDAERQFPSTDADEAYVAEQLVNHPKQRQEHRYAVDSLVERLQPYTRSLHAQDTPFVLRLPNVWHLATDVSAELNDDDGAPVSVVTLAEAVHPTAAVGGTPRDQAVDEIHRLENEKHGMDRGRYAGPVGWMDARGDGEFGIALRGGQLESPHTIRLYAGCGIVAGSDPEAELAETKAKMRPMLSALAELPESE